MMPRSGMDARVHPDLDVDTLAAVRDAVGPALLAGDLPQFGSAEWCDLAADDPAREHAVTRSAFALFLAVFTAAEVPAAVADRIVAERMKAASVEVASGTDWRAIANRRGRGEVERARLRPVTPARCTAAGCRKVLSVPHPLPDLALVRCADHPHSAEAAA